MLATDLGPASRVAMDEAIALAVQLGARLLVTNVVDTGEAGKDGGRRVDQVRAGSEAGAQEIVHEARSRGAEATFLVWEGDPGEAILNAAAAEGVDLIVVGSRGRSPVGRLLLGSVSDHIVRHADCPVLVVRADRDQRRGER
jgi:nucleotide-binding universal stress UspA family protein